MGTPKAMIARNAEGNDQEGPRLGFPPFDKAQVVQQDREAQFLFLAS